MNIKEKLNSFFNSYLYPVIIALVIFIGHTFSIEFFSVFVFIALLTASVIVCDDLKVIFPVFFMAIFTFSYKTFLNGTLSSVGFIAFAIICVVAFLTAFVFHYIKKRKYVRFKELPNSKLFWGIIAICIGFLLNGFFNFKNYEGINLIFALLLIVFFGLMYVIFFTAIENKKETIEYILHVFYVASLLLVAQVFVLLLRDASFTESGGIIKESLILGWGVWNNVGGMLTMLLPVHFYYASVKKHGYIYYATALITYLAIVFTLSRSSLLISSIISVACVLIICFKGENIKINRIITISLAVLGIIGVIILWDKISAIFTSYLNQGLSDNGRFALYKHGIENFLSHPIFGGGFGSCKPSDFGHGIRPSRYHNTIIQLLATCGIVGFGSYVFHRYQTVKLFLEKKNQLSTIFIALIVLGLLLTSLLDNHIFNFYPTMYYIALLCALEKCQSNDPVS